jgi:hypothetical protein
MWVVAIWNKERDPVIALTADAVAIAISSGQMPVWAESRKSSTDVRNFNYTCAIRLCFTLEIKLCFSPHIFGGVPPPGHSGLAMPRDPDREHG